MDIEPHVKWSKHKPRKGDKVIYRSLHDEIIEERVTNVEGNFCYVEHVKTGITDSFIWCFKDGLNNRHDWPAKNR